MLVEAPDLDQNNNAQIHARRSIYAVSDKVVGEPPR